ncbi:MAG: serine kinase [Deltaproteobacteria bacterium]|nr:serine kinase [Deltaproteobacteria bacterium]MBW2048741.1 serine kinase [Deltaproteobacteria bacterium]MBW2111866.1 serine kinase [Deltaproteobacteria bacterium]MBW2353128.1 serine kinase [Deltaproteobacteria bacterium]HDZ89802.1 serine kinase [Deltaproteobacteria bacterium]
MKLAEIVEKLQLTVRTGAGFLDREITRGYASDLMSDVMANANEGDLWVTLQIHQNIVAVAVMRSLGGIVLINGREPEDATVEKAEAEGLPILVSQMPAFELVGRLFELGISGI